jgi:hypothetical protein
MQKQVSLQGLMAKIDWLQIQGIPGGGQNKFDPKRIAISFKRNKKTNKVDSIEIKFGFEVVKDLGWMKGDKLYVFNDPNDLMMFRILKSKSREGYKLQEITNTPHFKIAFKWNSELILQEKKNEEVKFTIFMENVFFRVGESADFVL